MVEFEIGSRVRRASHFDTGLEELYHREGVVISSDSMYTTVRWDVPLSDGTETWQICSDGWEKISSSEQVIEVGDTVRIISKGNNLTGELVGFQFVVKEINCRFYRPTYGIATGVALQSIELVRKGSEQEIKVGDRVRIVCEYPDRTSGNDGKIGVVSKLEDRPKTYPYLIEMEDGGLGLGVHKVELLGSDRERKSIKENEEVKEEINKMEIEKPSTNLEKNACKKAKEESIESAINAKKFEYREVMDSFLSDEKTARRYRKLADDLKEKLGVTDKEMKELF